MPLRCCWIIVFLLGILFPLSSLSFCLAWMHVGATWMDFICPHRSWNGRINGPLVSFETIRFLIIFRHNIRGVWWFGVIGWIKSLVEADGWHMLLWVTCVSEVWIGRGYSLFCSDVMLRHWKLYVWLMTSYGSTGEVVGEFDGESSGRMVNVIIFLWPHL